MPHDANNREKSGKTAADQCRDLGLKNITISRRGAAGDPNAINRARNELPRCTFHAGTTERGIECLINFQRKWDDDAKAFSKNYDHNWASHGASAFNHFMDDIPAGADESSDFFSFNTNTSAHRLADTSRMFR
jgi:phage terminase large subunit